ncbi:MAG TPA: BrnT family toxin [Polyangiaceae bacterium]|nr:BrnT family toxin [Polyangiaceae bacterium]
MKVEWDPQKAASNKRKHGISFHEAVTCFADPSGLLLEDQVHPTRLVLIAVSEKSRVLYTVFAELTGDVVRIITARKATRHERRRYEEEGE